LITLNLLRRIVAGDRLISLVQLNRYNNPMAKSAKDPLIGSRIREYEILDSIGRGGMGAVYRARHVYLDKQRAIKVVHRSLTESEDFVNRFIREAKVLSELNHPNVVHLYDFGMIDDNTFFMVMELIQGETVIERIQRESRLSPEDSVQIVREAALGLSSAHKKGIIHRDISPDNLILVRNESGNEITKVVDFGIAKPLHEDTGRFTMTNFFIGKPEYSSPEQCGTLKDGENLDQRSDIYSLGVTFFQMLTGRLPFLASTPQGYLLKHANENPKLPSTYLPHGEIPKALDALVMKMLAKQRDERHRNLEKVIEELDNISITEGPTLTSLAKQAAMAELSTKKAEEVDAPTEPFEKQTIVRHEYTSTTPIRTPAKKKSNQTALIALLTILFLGIFGAGGFFVYRIVNETKTDLANTKLINSAEQALQSGDDKKAEELLKQAEAQKIPGQEERLNRLTQGIATIRKKRLQDTASEHLRKSKELIAAGKLDEASAELAALKSLSLPEFRQEIESSTRLIEERKKQTATLKEANQLLSEIDSALTSGNFELADRKLRTFKSKKFQGFENDVVLLDTKITDGRKQSNLQKGTQLLDDAEKLLNQQKVDSAAQRVKQVESLKIPDLEPRIGSLKARLLSLQNQNNENVAKARSLISSAKLLIQMGQITQAQQWLTQAQSLGVPEVQSEIDSLSLKAKNVNTNPAGLKGFALADDALKRGDWIEALKIVRANQANPPAGSEARIAELKERIKALQPYVGFGIRRKLIEADKKQLGAVVAQVDSGSPADRSGLKVGDVLIEYNGSVLVDESQLPWLGAYSKPGSTVQLKVMRNGERMNIRIPVESMRK
jgi:serine/threonine protein kinase